MKALSYITIIVLLVFNSCSSTLYTGAEYDDLYYSGSDKPETKQAPVAANQSAQKELRANDYYDNVYNADTLITDKYSLPSDYDDQIVANNSNMGGSGYDYYDDSYTNRINMFSGNYYYPSWQMPFSYGMGFNFGYPSFGFGYNYGFGYPYYGYNPYFYDPFFYDPFYYGGYNPYFGYGYGYGYGYGGYPYHSRYDSYSSNYGRRERPSNMSSRWNDNLGMGGSGRRSNDVTGGSYSASGRRTVPGGTQNVTPDARRSATGTTQGVTPRSASQTQRTQAGERPDYKSANRTYTPSYNNPRMSTRPSYNNSRVSNSPAAGSTSSNTARNFNSTAPVRNNTGRVYQQPWFIK